MNDSLKKLYNSLESGFFSFWIVYWKVSILLSLMIVFLGVFSMLEIPKESSPEIDFGIVNITTIYRGVNPIDMDDLITQEVEDAIEDIDGIKKITSSSRVGVASTTIELENGVDVSDFINDARSELGTVAFPAEAEDYIINEISPTQDLMYQVLLYGDEVLYPSQFLTEKARELKNELETQAGVSKVEIGGSIDYDVEVLLDTDMIEQLGISLSQVSQAVRAYNQNNPLGNFEVEGYEYDFRIQGERDTVEQLLTIPVVTNGFSTTTLGDISIVRRTYSNETISKLGKFDQMGYNSITLGVSKSSGVSIFEGASLSKERITELLKTQAFEGLQVEYVNDLAENIQDDYDVLTSSGVQTLIFVFLCLLLFVGFKESFIATLGIPLAFFVTFIVLNQLGYTLNFLTNFSLILTLGIAIDTSIVVIEAAYERIKMGFTPKTAALLAVRDFKAPLIAGTSTTLVVFIPMMVLPGITGKFLAYIPITVFITLIAALFVALTLNAAWFYKLSKNKSTYLLIDNLEQFLSKEDKEILEYERIGKQARGEAQMSWKQRTLEKLNSGYENILRGYLASRAARWLSVALPFVLLVLTFIFLSPSIGFTLFPAGDEGRFDMNIEGPVGLTTQQMSKWISYIQPTLSAQEEINTYTLDVSGNKISIGIELLDKDFRSDEGMRNVFEVEEAVVEELGFLVQEGLIVESKPLAGGPPQAKPVALKLEAQRGEQFDQLIDVAATVESYIKTIDGTKNVSVSSQRTPGQFIYEFDDQVISRLGLSPNQVAGELAFALNGLNAGSLTIDGEERDIKILYDRFADSVTPTDVGSIILQTPTGPVSANEFLSYRIDNAVAEIAREGGKITVTVSADLEEEFLPKAGGITTDLLDRASQQTFPEGISYVAGGENQENADLIAATIQGFVIAVFLIFVILVLQFNSFGRPTVIMYSVVCALLGVNIGLYVTGNPYSMSFAIGFIALTGIVVNDAIVLLDRIQQNLKHDVNDFEAIIEAGRSRLQPIILTTLTTLLGVLPISLQDEFRAGLGFTMIFGLFAGSAMTLFVIPSLYTMLFIKNEEIPGTHAFKDKYGSKEQYIDKDQ